MSSRFIRTVLVAVLIASFSLTSAQPARADGAAFTRNIIIGGVLAAAGIIIGRNVAHKAQLASTIVGYTQDGATVYADGRVVREVYGPASAYYPNDHGQQIACRNMLCTIYSGNPTAYNGYYEWNGTTWGPPAGQPQYYPQAQPQPQVQPQPQYYPQPQPQPQPQYYPQAQPQYYPQAQPQYYPQAQPQYYPEAQPQYYPQQQGYDMQYQTGYPGYYGGEMANAYARAYDAYYRAYQVYYRAYSDYYSRMHAHDQRPHANAPQPHCCKPAANPHAVGSPQGGGY